jgi:hypothetical protein
MTPWEKFVASDQFEEGDMPVNAEGKPSWSWRAALPMWVFHRLQAAGLTSEPDWDDDGVSLSPPFVMIGSDGGERSRRAATELDDVATGLFYYRDWTNSGTPCVAEGELYFSGFWFQRMADAEAFHKKWGGIASWELDFNEKERKISEMRGKW